MEMCGTALPGPSVDDTGATCLVHRSRWPPQMLRCDSCDSIYPHLNNRFPVPHLPFPPYHLAPPNPWPHMNPRLPAPSLPSSSTCIASAPKYAESITNSKGFPAIAIDGNVYIKKAQRKNWVTYRCQHFRTLNCSSVCNVDKDMRILKAPGLHSHPICETLQKTPSTHATSTFVKSR